jgi:hypothetical protein
MPEHARRFAAALYDQQSEDRQIADWGGDELFTRMPRPRPVDTAPPPRFRRELPAEDAAPKRRVTRERPLALVEPPDATAAAAPTAVGATRAVEPPDATTAAAPTAVGATRAVEPSAAAAPVPTGEDTMRARAERVGLALVPAEPERAANGRRSTVITGRPDGVPRPFPIEPAERRRPARTPAQWVGPRPERIVGWAFALGLLLILIAISTADAATV